MEPLSRLPSVRPMRNILMVFHFSWKTCKSFTKMFGRDGQQNILTSPWKIFFNKKRRKLISSLTKVNFRILQHDNTTMKITREKKSDSRNFSPSKGQDEKNTKKCCKRETVTPSSIISLLAKPSSSAFFWRLSLLLLAFLPSCSSSKKVFNAISQQLKSV